MIPEMTISRLPMSIAKPDMMCSDHAISPIPAAIRMRRSTLPISRPASTMVIKVPIPRGIVNSPDWNTEWPYSRWSNGGSSASPASSSRPVTTMKNMPSAKLRSANMPHSNNGSRAVRV